MRLMEDGRFLLKGQGSKLCAKKETHSCRQWDTKRGIGRAAGWFEKVSPLGDEYEVGMRKNGSNS